MGVASSSWMWLFTKMGTGEQPEVVDQNPGAVYKVQYRMAPRNLEEFNKAVASYTNIILVRPPLSRLISAYRDRVATMKFPPQVARDTGLLLSNSRRRSEKLERPSRKEFLKESFNLSRIDFSRKEK